jgi:hypothetical protein
MADDNFPTTGSAQGSVQIPARGRNAASPPAGKRRRLIVRLLALPAVAAAVYVMYTYGGLRDYLELPQCNSDHAKEWLGQALQPFNFGPPRYETIKTVSSSKQETVCNAVLAFPNGSNIAVDYSFYWSGSKVNMRYSVPLTGSGSPPPAPPGVPVR